MEQLLQLWNESGIYQMQTGQFFMILIGLGLLYLAITKNFEPLLLVPIGFGGILANIPGAELDYTGVERLLMNGDAEAYAVIAALLDMQSVDYYELKEALSSAPASVQSAVAQLAADYGYGSGMLAVFYSVAI